MALRTGALRRVGRAALVTWFLLPLVPLLLWAVADRWSAPDVLPQRWGLSGAKQALDSGAVGAALRSTVLGLGVTVLAVPAGSVAARALVRQRVLAPRLVGALLLVPLALPPFAVSLGMDVALLRARIPAPLGVLLLLVVAALPYTAYTMRVAHGAWDTAVEDEARTLGATGTQVFWRVRLPGLAPAYAAAAFLAFLVGWSDYVVTLLVGGGSLVTLPLLVAGAATRTGSEPLLAALSVLSVLPPLGLLLAVASMGRRRR